MRWGLLLAAAFLAGCAQPLLLAPAGSPDVEGGRLVMLSFAQPVLLTTAGGGFEPSLVASPDGALYATAAKSSRPNAGTQLASWLWHSMDGGTTWGEVPSPLGLHELFWGAEGDIAVDAEGRLYFVDTYLADNTISRWSPSTSGPSWDFTRPVQGTLALLDDRPWLTAHDDGVVYLMSNNAEDVPARMMLFRSLDGGLTWSFVQGFSHSFCMPHASMHDGHTVTVACQDNGGAGSSVAVYRSPDRGSTWSRVLEVPLSLGAGYLTPAVASDAAGWTYVAWLDERVDWSGVQDVAWAGGQPGRVMVARSPDGEAWEVLDVTPSPGRFGMLHATAGREGVLALTFYATDDLEPDGSTAWHARALVGTDAAAQEPAWAYGLVAEEPMGRGTIPPRDFFQNALGPDDVLHVILQRNRDEPGAPGEGIRADVLHARQLAGPNLGPEP